MKLREIFTQLSQGEFRQKSLGGAEESGILEVNYPKVVPHIWLGLTEIYKRFPLKTKQVTIQQYGHISNYFLDTRYAETNTTSLEPYKYIKDTQFQPFDDNDDVLKIERVFDENGTPYPMNDDKEVLSIFTPSYNQIQVPFNDADNAMTVQYRANHPKIPFEGEGVLDQEILISPTYLQPLLLFIAGRYYSTSGNAESQAAGDKFNARFELSCADIERLNLGIEDHTSNEKLEDRGFV